MRSHGINKKNNVGERMESEEGGGESRDWKKRGCRERIDEHRK